MLIDYEKVRTETDHIYKMYAKNEDENYEETAIVIEIHHPCYKIIRQIIEMNKRNYKPQGKKGYMTASSDGKNWRINKYW